MFEKILINPYPLQRSVVKLFVQYLVPVLDNNQTPLVQAILQPVGRHVSLVSVKNRFQNLKKSLQNLKTIINFQLS